jgi:PAS domain S-box-containing protein
MKNPSEPEAEPQGRGIGDEGFSEAFEFASIGMALVALDGRWLKVNRAICNLVGYSESELLQKSFQDITHPDDLEEDLGNSRKLVAGEIRSYEMEKRYFHRAGHMVEVLLTVSLVVDKAGKPLHFFSQVQDITVRNRQRREVERVNRALELLNSGNETLIRARLERELLNEICRIAVEIGGYRMAWVGYARDDESRALMPMAHAGAEAGYLSEIKFSWADDGSALSGTPMAQTIRSGNVCVTEDFDLEPTDIPWRQAARQRGYRSLICLPLRDGPFTFGLLGLYSALPHQAGPDEIALLQKLADNLAFGISNIRSREEQRRMQDSVLAIARGVSASEGNDFFESLTVHMVHALQADLGFIALIDAPGGNSMHTTYALLDGRRMDDFSYDLAGTPCEDVARGQLCVVTSGLAQRFPEALMVTMGMEGYVGSPLYNAENKVVGLMAVAFRQPFVRNEFITSTIQILSTRVASEIDRLSNYLQIREQASLLDKARDAILVRDLQHRVTYWNKSAERLYGWPSKDVLGKSIAKVLYKDEPLFNQAMAKVLENGEWNGELENVRQDGTPVTVEARWTLVRDEKGAPKSVLCINTDVSEKKRIEAQSLRTQRMESIGTLAGGIAHDLNNVLAPILMSVELLRDKVQDDDEGNALLTTLKTSALRGADLVRQVLSFARGIEGQRIAVNPEHLVRDIQKIAHDTFSRNIEVKTSAPRDLWTVTGDPTQLYQVLMNLSVNARDAMPNGGTLIITMENILLDKIFADSHVEAQPGPHVLISVKDTGIGMSREVQDKIFEPFFTTKEVGKGTGLGLSTVLAILQSHHGFVHVQSAPGMGSVFKIYLPANFSGVPVDESGINGLHLPRGNGQLILLVDDEEGIRNIAKKTLEFYGYRVLTASNGAEAISLYAQNREKTAVVITDMVMPVMDGPSTILALQSINPQIKVIGSSGLASQGGVNKAVGAGIKHFISKPYTADALLQTLDKVLREVPVDEARDSLLVL